MIRLDLKREPHWLDLGHGVRLHVRSCTTALMMAARAEVCTAPGFSDTRQPYAAWCVVAVAAIQVRLVSAGLR
jgi:hypothetical protein